MLLRNFTLLLLILLFWGCTSHPPVLPQTPMKGQTNSGFALSAENVIPVIWWKHGLNRYTEIGFKMGIPFSGTGIDFSRVLSKRDRKWEVLNIAYSLSPNSSFDLTYYVFKGRKERDGQLNPFKISWMGYRAMIIPNGYYDNPTIKGNQSTRFGLLTGRRFNYRWGAEIGYFHDFRSGFDSKNTDFPHKHEGWPTQFSTGVGFSLQFFMYLEPRIKKNI